MIYFCADDYGLDDTLSMRIQQCIDAGALNKVSIFPNFNKIDLDKMLQNKNLRVSLHLNFVEGKCMTDADKINLLADKNGNFKHTFAGLLKLNIFKRKKFQEQVYKEINAQVLFWKNILPKDAFFSIDSHQHTHMIPAVFKALLKVLEDEKINPDYIRIPAEPISLFLKTPSLYFTYNPVNIIKQWLLKFLWMFSKKHAENISIPTAYFLGILFSGKMDIKRVNKILPKYIKMAQKNKKDIEILFHPGYLNKIDDDFNDKNIVFKDFYLSKNRKTEFNSVIKISERSVF